MARIKISYMWPEGCALSVEVKANVTTPEAMADLRIEAKRLWHEAMVEMRADDLAHGGVAPDGLVD